jgi:hypothetical protein
MPDTDTLRIFSLGALTAGRNLVPALANLWAIPWASRKVADLASQMLNVPGSSHRRLAQVFNYNAAKLD